MSLSSISIERPVLAIVMSIVIVVFGILGFLMAYGSFRRKAKPFISRKHTFTLILIAAAYGALTEIFQGLFFASRFADFMDFVADTIGAVLGILVARKLLTKK